MKKMNRYLFLFLGLVLPLASQAQNTVWAESQIDSVTVYLQGALVHRSFEVNLLPGDNDVVFEDLTATMETSTVVIGLSDGLTPSSVTTEQNNWNPYGVDMGFTALKDSLDAIDWEIEYIDNEIKALEEELSVLKANRELDATNLTTLEEVSTYMRTRTLEIRRQLSTLSRSKSTWAQRQQVATRELNRYRQGIPQYRKKIGFIVDASRAQKVNGTLSYYVSGANWNAEYDVKVANLDSDLSIVYKANVYNGTYEDWNEVRVRVSTATPSLNVTLPSLSVWRLNSRADMAAAEAGWFTQNALPTARAEWGAMDDFEAEPNFNDEPISDTEVIEAGEFAVEFRIGEAISLKGNYEQRVYELHTLNTGAGYEHYAIPKLGKQVYLIARVADWNRLNLLSGKANIYLNDRYTGQSNINIRNVTDTLDFSLGIDPQVLVSRKLEEDFTERILVGTKYRSRKGYSLYVKNSRSEDINIRILDQHPISTQEEVTVTLVENNGAEVNEETGQLTWNITLPPGETKEMGFTFEVVYPKNMDVKLRESRQQYRSQRFSY